MKRSLLPLIFTCLASLLATAQHSTLSNSATSANLSLPVAGTNQEPDGGEAAEYVPLNNTPFFPGGQNALLAYFLNPDLYPYAARTIEGTVQVCFRVQPTGYLTHIRVVASQGYLLDQAALRAVAQMPRWYPAHQAGMAVACPVALAIRFESD